MASFIKNIFSSCLGTLLALTLGIFILVGIGAAIGSLQSEEGLTQNSILRVKVPQIAPERTNNTTLGLEQALKDEKVWSIHELAFAITHAASDDQIKAMLIEPGFAQGFEHTDLIRNSIQTFKASGKPVYAYSEYYSQGDYYMASAADKIFLHPMGMIELIGFSIVQPYLKSTLDHLGITAEVYYAGDFKSATEPFRADQMSRENRLQLKELLDEMHHAFVDSIAASRKMESSQIQYIINHFASKTAENALNLGLADAIGYETDMINTLKNAIDLDWKEEIGVIDISDYRNKISKKKNYGSKDKIAIVYAEGEITRGSEKGSITSEIYLPILREIRKDENIKAVVLRVNSPGGDMYTSENILRELELIQEAGKPVVVSMGDYAASGGYYISMGADSIIASPKTLTGSIGVFTMFPNFSGLLQEKLDVHMDSITTAPYATFGSVVFERSASDKAIFQSLIDTFYLKFIDRVAESRNMTRQEVQAIAQGRVWTGTKGLANGLVDKLGTLEDAIVTAGRMVDLEEYRLDEYPKMKSALVELTEQLEGNDSGKKILASQLQQNIPGWKYFDKWIRSHDRQPMDYLLPYQISW